MESPHTLVERVKAAEYALLTAGPEASQTALDDFEAAYDPHDQDFGPVCTLKPLLRPPATATEVLERRLRTTERAVSEELSPEELTRALDEFEAANEAYRNAVWS